MQLTNAQREGAAALFTSARADADDMAQAMRWAWESCGELIDPHTAIGLHAARAAGSAARRPDRHAGDRASGQVPRRGRARHRPAPAAARARRRPVRPRGALRRAAGRLRRDRRLRRRARDADGLMAELLPQPLILAGEGWADYGLVDSGHGRKLERYGPLPLHPPRAAGAVDAAARPTGTPTANSSPAPTRTAAAAGSSTEPVPREGWPLGWDEVRFTAQCTPFRHLGFFPDMAPVWDWMREQLAGKPDAATLNLFGYTGVGTLALSRIRPGHPRRCVEEVGRPGARQRRAVGHGRAPDPLDRRRRRQVRRARGAPRASATTGSSSIRPSSAAGPKARSGGSRSTCRGLIADCRRLLDADSRFLFLTVYAVRMSSLAIAGLLGRALRRPARHDRARRPRGARGRRAGRLLPTAIFARWRNG